MKKTLSSLAAILMLMTTTGAQAVEPSYLMTKDDMLAIYQQSFDRMNTTMDVNLMTLDELPVWEKEYTQNTGYERKDDLIISSLPMEGDKTYEQALELAKGALSNKFGVTEETLDAMGVYPLLMDYVYMEDESEWEFYFTPRTNTDIMLDHVIPAEGEYRVILGAQSGRLIGCHWYSNNKLSDTKLVSIAEAAAQEQSDTVPEAEYFRAAPGYVHHYNQAAGTCLVLIYSDTADQPGGDNHVYQVTLNYKTGEIVKMEYTDGVG